MGEHAEQPIDPPTYPRDPRALRAAIIGHRPHDERESLSRLRILSALEVLVDPFDEDSDAVHLTASAILVGPRGTVLHRHKRLGRWMQPGGHIDPGEDPPQAALRESREETGLVLWHPDGGPRMIHVDVHAASRGHIHLDLRFLLVASDEEPSPSPGESQQVRWCSWPEAQRLADEALSGALKVARLQPEVCGASSASLP